MPLYDMWREVVALELQVHDLRVALESLALESLHTLPPSAASAASLPEQSAWPNPYQWDAWLPTTMGAHPPTAPHAQEPQDSTSKPRSRRRDWLRAYA